MQSVMIITGDETLLYWCIAAGIGWLAIVATILGVFDFIGKRDRELRKHGGAIQ